jgi:hypothetical protein
LKECDLTDGRSLSHEQKTFEDLADHYEKHYAKEPEYVDGRKVADLRSLYCSGAVKKAQGAFRQSSGTLTHADIRGFRADRLKTPTRARCGAS